MGEPTAPPTPPDNFTSQPSTDEQIPIIPEFPDQPPLEQVNIPPQPPPLSPPPLDTKVPFAQQSQQDLQGSKSSITKFLLPVVAILLFSGLAIVGLFFLTRRGSEETKPVVTEPIQVSPTPAVAPVQGLALSVFSPKEGEKITTQQFSVSGAATPGSIVAFITGVSEDSIVVQAIGSFASALTLAPGTNELTVVAVDLKGNEKRDKLVIVYEATPSAKPKSQSLNKQIVHGIVTGINDSIITILSPGKPEKFYNLTAAASAVVKIGTSSGTISDIALGQRVLVVGSLEEKNSLLAKLIHIFSEATSAAR